MDNSMANGIIDWCKSVVKDKDIIYTTTIPSVDSEVIKNLIQ